MMPVGPLHFIDTFLRPVNSMIADVVMTAEFTLIGLDGPLLMIAAHLARDFFRVSVGLMCGLT